MPQAARASRLSRAEPREPCILFLMGWKPMPQPALWPSVTSVHSVVRFVFGSMPKTRTFLTAKPTGLPAADGE